MKFIHCADIHLDSKMETNLPASKARERKKEILATFERMVEYASKNDIRAIIIAGDMFDTTRIASSTKLRILNLTRKNSGVDFLYLAGNHDENNFIASIEELPLNLKIFGKDWTNFVYDNVCISGIMMTDENCKVLYDTINLPNDKLNIVVMHGQVVKNLSKPTRESIVLQKLANKSINYLALGHIHSYCTEKLDKTGVYAYSGCLEGRGFDECGEKGFVVLETSENQIQSRFVQFAKRTISVIEFDISNFDNWFEIEDAITQKANEIDKNNLLKITLTGRYNLKMEKHISMLEQKLDDFYFVKIKDQSVLKVDVSDVENDCSLKGEFIRKVLESSLSDEEKEQTILVGMKSLMLEDL